MNLINFFTALASGSKVEEPTPPGENAPPVAKDKFIQAFEDVVFSLIDPLTGLLAGATDPGGDNIIAVAVVGGVTDQGGEITINADGTFSYTPPLGFTGNDTYTFIIEDDGDPVANDTGLLTMIVDPVGDLLAGVTLSPIVAGEHKAFVAAVVIDTRFWAFYRRGIDHDVSLGGDVVAKYTDDLGQTWSAEQMAYTGNEVLIEEPIILQTHPDAECDARDPEAYLMSNGDVMLCSFVAIASMVNGVRTGITIAPKWRTRAVRIPVINTNELDFANKTIVQVAPNLIELTTSPLTGVLFEDGGKIFTAIYPADGDVDLYRSDDFGDTWVYESEIFDGNGPNMPPTVPGVNETTIVKVGSVLYAFARPWAGNYGAIARSFDLGVTWVSFTQLSTRLDGPDTAALPDDKVIFAGGDRINVPRGTKYQIYEGLYPVSPVINLDPVATSNTDMGYPSMINHAGNWYMLWYRGIEDGLGKGYTGVHIKQFFPVSVEITGVLEIGQVLTAGISNDSQGGGTYQWYADGVAMGGQTASTYTLVSGDEAKGIKVIYTVGGVDYESFETPVLNGSPVFVEDGEEYTTTSIYQTFDAVRWREVPIIYSATYSGGALPSWATFSFDNIGDYDSLTDFIRITAFEYSEEDATFVFDVVGIYGGLTLWETQMSVDVVNLLNPNPIMNEGFEVHVPIDDPGSQPFRTSGTQDVVASSTDFAKSGTKSIKSRIPNADASGVSPWRSEMQHKGGGTILPLGSSIGQNHVFGTVRTFGFSVYVPAGFVADPVEDIIMQWKNLGDPGDSGDPPLTIRMSNNNIKYNFKWNDNPEHTGVGGGLGGGVIFGDLNGSIALGVWHEIVIEILYDWNPAGNGYVKIWYKENGVIDKVADLLVDYSGPIGYNDEVGPFLKLGVYKGTGWNTAAKRLVSTNVGVTERLLYYDDVFIVDGPWVPGSQGGTPPTVFDLEELFEDWTADDPDLWTISGESGSDEVTESPANHMNLISVSGANVSATINAVLSTQTDYFYEIDVTTVNNGSVRVNAIGGTSVTIHSSNSTGVLSGSFNSGDNTNVQIKRNSGATNFVINSIKIWAA